METENDEMCLKTDEYQALLAKPRSYKRGMEQILPLKLQKESALLKPRQEHCNPPEL